MIVAAPRAPRDEELSELPELPPLDGEDELLGGDLGEAALSEGDASLDDAAADFAVDVALDEGSGGLDDEAGGFDFGDARDDIAFDDEAGALDDRAFEDRAISNDLDIAAFAEGAGDRGEDGPMEELLELDAPPPLDEDDEVEAPFAPRRSHSASVVSLGVEDVAAVAIDGARVLLLADDVTVKSLDPRGGSVLARHALPDALCGALSVDREGAPALASLDGAVLTLDGDGAWREVLSSDHGALWLTHEGGRLWVRTRAGGLVVVGGATRKVDRGRRVVAWGADPSGGVAVIDSGDGGALVLIDDGKTLRRRALPVGSQVTRVALRGEAVAIAEGGDGRCWLSVDRGASWSQVPVSQCVDVALIESDDGRATLIAATRGPGSFELVTLDCEALDRVPRRVATLSSRDADDALTLVGAGREGVLCVVLVEGVAYAVSPL